MISELHNKSNDPVTLHAKLSTLISCFSNGRAARQREGQVVCEGIGGITEDVLLSADKNGMNNQVVRCEKSYNRNTTAAPEIRSVIGDLTTLRGRRVRSLGGNQSGARRLSAREAPLRS